MCISRENAVIRATTLMRSVPSPRLAHWPTKNSAMIHTAVDEDYGALATGLLSQQLWCYGRDVKRNDGNWLTEFGFRRHSPPPDRKDCSSIYTLELNRTQRIVLRGFGIFLGDDSFGGLFIERFSFRPLIAVQPRLTKEPWACEDLPPLHPASSEQDSRARVLLLELIDWIIHYELETASRLGSDYRRETLKSWENGERWSVPAHQMARLWRKLSHAISDCRWNPMCQNKTPVETNRSESSTLTA